MSTTAGIQAVLDPNSYRNQINIIREVGSGASTQYYCTGGQVSPGKARWVVVNASSNDATNAAAIVAALAL